MGLKGASDVGLRERSEDRRDPSGKRVQDFGSAEHAGVTAPCPVRLPRGILSFPSASLCFPLAGTGEGKRQGRATSIHLESRLLGRESGGGNVSRSGAKARSLCLIVLGLEIEMFPL